MRIPRLEQADTSVHTAQPGMTEPGLEPRSPSGEGPTHISNSTSADRVGWLRRKGSGGQDSGQLGSWGKPAPRQRWALCELASQGWPRRVSGAVKPWHLSKGWVVCVSETAGPQPRGQEEGCRDPCRGAQANPAPWPQERGPVHHAGHLPANPAQREPAPRHQTPRRPAGHRQPSAHQARMCWSPPVTPDTPRPPKPSPSA